MSNGIRIDDSQWIHTAFYIPTYRELRTTHNIQIHPDSAAAQLGLTLEELTPILQDWQQEHQLHKLEYEATQPPHNFVPTVHPDLAAAQLGLSMESLKKVLVDQREWMREEEEEEQRYREGRHTTAGTPDQEQYHNDDTNT